MSSKLKCLSSPVTSLSNLGLRTSAIFLCTVTICTLTNNATAQDQNYGDVRGHFNNLDSEDKSTPTENTITEGSSHSRSRTSANEPDSFDIKQHLQEAKESLKITNPGIKKERSNSTQKRSWVANMSLDRGDMSGGIASYDEFSNPEVTPESTNGALPQTQEPNTPEVTNPKEPNTQMPPEPIAAPVQQPKTLSDEQMQALTTNRPTDDQPKPLNERNAQLAEEIIQRAASVTRHAKSNLNSDDTITPQSRKVIAAPRRQTSSDTYSKESSNPSLEALREQIRQFNKNK